MALLQVPPVRIPLRKGMGTVLLACVTDLAAADPSPRTPWGGRPFHPLDQSGLVFGVNLVSPRTGRRAVWVVVGKWCNEDDRVAWWDLVPTPFTLLEMPGLAPWSLRVFNDAVTPAVPDDDRVVPDGNNP